MRLFGSSGFTLHYGERSPTMVDGKASTAGLRLRMTSASFVSLGGPHPFQSGRHPPRDARVVEQLMKNERLVVGAVIVIQCR
jgi:hypothetical protein